MIEESKPIEGFSKYRVTRSGKILTSSGNVLAPAINGSGRRYASAKMMSDSGKFETRSLPKLVALAFIPNPEGATKVTAKDGNPLNTSADNIAWKVPKGYIPRERVLRRSPSAKFTDEQVIAIRESYDGKHGSLKRIADQYGTGLAVIRKILMGETYKDLPNPIIYNSRIQRTDGVQADSTT